MASLFSEDFEGASVGTTLSATNSSIAGPAVATGGSQTFASGGITGQCVTSTVAGTSGSTNFFWNITARSDGSYGAYFAIPSNPAAALAIMQGRSIAAGQNRWQVRISTTGKLELRNGNGTTLVATSTTTVTGGSLFRVELVISGTTQTASIFVGGNVNGTTPDEQISGAFTSATFDRVTIGIVTATTSWSVSTDAVRANDTTSGTGPAVTAFTGSAALTGSGVLSVVAAVALSATAALTGSGSLSTTGAPSASATANLTGSGTLTASGAPGVAATAALSGSGTLTTSGAPSWAATAAFTGSGTLTSSGTPALTGAAGLTGSGTLGVTGVGTSGATAALTGSGTLTASGVPSATGTAALGGSGALTTTGNPSVSLTVTLTGSGALAATALPALATTVDLSGSGTLGTTGTPALSTAADLTGSGELTADAAPSLTGTADLDGSGTLTAVGSDGPPTPLPDWPRDTTLTFEPPRTLTIAGEPRALTPTDTSRTLEAL